MDLLIHDLTPEEWAEISGSYEGWRVISDNGTIRPCTGCFGCWCRDPGRCVQKDGYESMGSHIHEADEVVVLSRYTYGGFSGFVKNVFDRCLAYVLPQFEIVNGESHHKKRYSEDKPFTFIFYGHNISSEEKECARRYVQAVCTNIRGHVKEVIFREQDNKPVHEEKQPVFPENYTSGTARTGPAGKIVLLNGSLRHVSGNSAKLAAKLAELLLEKPASGNSAGPEKQIGKEDVEIAALAKFADDLQALSGILADASAIVLCIPLYVDGLPSQVIRFMEWYEEHYCGEAKKIYVLANMGLYESRQLVNLFSAVRQWCEKMHFVYCGGLGISGGEMIGVLMGVIPFRSGPVRKIAEKMELLAGAIRIGADAGDIYAEPYRFPRTLYILIANTNWNSLARKNGIRPKDLYRRV